jgi:curved DNA-binding protein CbpA
MNFDPHPYQVLEIDPLASPGEILKAFAQAMQRKQYPPAVLAAARKILMDPAQRTLAHYLCGDWPMANSGPSAAVPPETKDGQSILQSRIDQLQVAIDSLNNSSINPDLTAAQIVTEQKHMQDLLSQDFTNS